MLRLLHSCHQLLLRSAMLKQFYLKRFNNLKIKTNCQILQFTRCQCWLIQGLVSGNPRARG